MGSPKIPVSYANRPILDGKYLEYKLTAEDPKAFYTRYNEKLKTDILEDVCEE